MKKLLAVLSLVITLTLATSTTAQAKSLASEARHVALHGGITGTCHGCATKRMQDLMVKVYMARFASSGPSAQRTAVCLMKDESGANPGAISDGDDFGGPQMNWRAHHNQHPEWYAPGRGFSRLIFDPWYGASQMWAMSSRGKDWSPWTGTYGQGMCH